MSVASVISVSLILAVAFLPVSPAGSRAACPGEGVESESENITVLYSYNDFVHQKNKIADLQISKVQQVQQKIWRGSIIG